MYCIYQFYCSQKSFWGYKSLHTLFFQFFKQSLVNRNIRYGLGSLANYKSLLYSYALLCTEFVQINYYLIKWTSTTNHIAFYTVVHVIYTIDIVDTIDFLTFPNLKELLLRYREIFNSLHNSFSFDKWHKILKFYLFKTRMNFYEKIWSIFGILMSNNYMI